MKNKVLHLLKREIKLSKNYVHIQNYSYIKRINVYIYEVKNRLMTLKTSKNLELNNENLN